MSVGSSPRAHARFFAVSVALLASSIACALEQNTFEHSPSEARGDLEPVVVTATLRPTLDLEVPASVTVLNDRALHGSGQTHLEDVLTLVPNLNFAAGTNRARYFQLRGIGELDQYEGAPNPSVGLLVDDIDFSGLGSMATLFDIDRVEVLRGPQGTRYGANALAGLMYLASAAPLSDWGSRLETSAGNYGTRSVGGVLTGPLADLNSTFRIAGERYTSDGYYRNDYLNRNDTNGRNESTLRGRWRWQPSPTLQVDIAALHVDIHDGYDAFSPENGRVVHSDKPGVDEQRSNGLSARATWSGPADQSITAIGTWGDSRIVYSYDGDWGNPVYWAPTVYDFIEVQHRHRTTRSAELRYASSPKDAVRWVAGVYALSLHEQLNDLNLGVSIDPVYGEYDLHTVLDSGYQSRALAAFGAVDGDFDRRTHWSLGLRAEQRRSDYSDRLNDLVYAAQDAHAFSPSDTLYGGHIALTHALDEHRSVYAQLSRGYKAGGFNLSQGLAPSELTFRPESDWNSEIGYKMRGARFELSADVFYVTRQQAQLRSGVQTDPANPNSFIFYTGNAASGRDYGAEVALLAQASERVTVGLTGGWLHTYFENFTRVGDGGFTSISRELPHAPKFSGRAHVEYRTLGGLYARLDVNGMSGFYYDLPPNDTRSGSYALAHLRLGYDGPRWSADAYIRNLTDHKYTTRGFYFGLVPPDYPNSLYVQLGEPRVYGVEFTFRTGALETR